VGIRFGVDECHPEDQWRSNGAPAARPTLSITTNLKEQQRPRYAALESRNFVSSWCPFLDLPKSCQEAPTSQIAPKIFQSLEI
jgi:hypothetical protein